MTFRQSHAGHPTSSHHHGTYARIPLPHRKTWFFTGHLFLLQGLKKQASLPPAYSIFLNVGVSLFIHAMPWFIRFKLKPSWLSLKMGIPHFRIKNLDFLPIEKAKSLGEHWGTIPMFCPWALDPSSKDAYLAGHRDSQLRRGACVAKDGIDQVPLIFFHQGTTPATCGKAHQRSPEPHSYLRYPKMVYIVGFKIVLLCFAKILPRLRHLYHLIYSYHLGLVSCGS